MSSDLTTEEIEIIKRRTEKDAKINAKIALEKGKELGIQVFNGLKKAIGAGQQPKHRPKGVPEPKKEIHNLSAKLAIDHSNRAKLLKDVVTFMNQLEKEHKEIFVKQTKDNKKNKIAVIGAKNSLGNNSEGGSKQKESNTSYGKGYINNHIRNIDGNSSSAFDPF